MVRSKRGGKAESRRLRGKRRRAYRELDPSAPLGSSPAVESSLQVDALSDDTADTAPAGVSRPCMNLLGDDGLVDIWRDPGNRSKDSSMYRIEEIDLDAALTKIRVRCVEMKHLLNLNFFCLLGKKLPFSEFHL